MRKRWQGLGGIWFRGSTTQTVGSRQGKGRRTHTQHAAIAPPRFIPASGLAALSLVERLPGMPIMAISDALDDMSNVTVLLAGLNVSYAME